MKVNKGMRAFCLLLVMALLGAVFVPAVSAVDVETVEKYYVNPNDSYLIAKQTLDDFISSGALDKEIFADSQLSKDPMIIYDSNGLKLFYQYEITKDGKNVGLLRMAASKVLGSPVIMLQETPDSINYQNAITKSEELLKSTFKDAEYSEPLWVCYSYPKIGIMYEVTEKGNEAERVIIDAANLFIVPDEYPKNSGEAGTWSLYDGIEDDQITERLNRWNIETNVFDLSSNVQKSKSFHSKTLWAAGNLETQPNDFWCQVTTAKMIAYWYGTSHTLEHIADVMDAWNYSTSPKSPGGATDRREEYYYDGSSEGLQMNAIRIDHNRFQWMDFKDQINNDDVITSTIPRHVRACDGYGYYDSGGQYMHIYDPLGKRYWESVWGVTKKSEIFIKCDQGIFNEFNNKKNHCNRTDNFRIHIICRLPGRK